MLPEIQAPKPYDFHAGWTLSPAQLQVISNLMQDFAVEAGKMLSKILKINISMSFHRVLQSPISQVFHMLETSCFISFDMPPFSGEGMIFMESALAYAFSNKMLGGGGELPHQAHSLSKLEMAVNRKIFSYLLKELCTSWKTVTTFDYSINKIESEVSPFSFSDYKPYIQSYFLLSFGPISSYIAILLPSNNFEPFSRRLDELSNEDFNQKKIDDACADNIPIELTVSLGKTTLSMEETKSLQLGDVISLQHKATDPLVVLIANEPAFYAHPGLKGMSKAVRLLPYKKIN